MLRKKHPKKTWLNCGLDFLCVMLFYDGDELARIVEKVLSKCCVWTPTKLFFEM